jgi:hypothetical protein
MPEFLVGALIVVGYVIIGILPIALLGLAIPYAVLRLRNEDPPDPLNSGPRSACSSSSAWPSS